MLRLKLGCRTSGYSSNSIITVLHTPAAAHEYVLLNVILYHKNGGTLFPCQFDIDVLQLIWYADNNVSESTLHWER